MQTSEEEESTLYSGNGYRKKRQAFNMHSSSSGKRVMKWLLLKSSGCLKSVLCSRKRSRILKWSCKAFPKGLPAIFKSVSKTWASELYFLGQSSSWLVSIQDSKPWSRRRNCLWQISPWLEHFCIWATTYMNRSVSFTQYIICDLTSMSSVSFISLQT